MRERREGWAGWMEKWDEGETNRQCWMEEGSWGKGLRWVREGGKGRNGRGVGGLKV